ncbi:MAG: hypothetical protein SFV51_19545 [Bryobacteraceae bacterium]|nr:hypothetical protein [Bryobacteraceae bacterium]
MLREAVRYLQGAAGDYYRRAAGIRRMVKALPSTDPVSRIRQQLLQREIVFLDTVLRVVFERADNPYFHMFRMAGCNFEDLEEIVMREGLEAALTVLHRAGVYLTHDEFKGKTAVVRNGREIPACIQSFANPFTKGVISGTSSGSRSRGTRTVQSAEVNVYREGYELLQRREFGFSRRAQIQLKPLLPSTAGLTACLRAARRGWRVDKWFAPDVSFGKEGVQWLSTSFATAVARTAGAAMPFPSMLPGNDFTPVARWIAESKKRGRDTFVSAMTGYAVRVADAALQGGYDISGAIFVAGGEAVSPAKRALVEAAGAEIYPMYWIHEIGPIGFACRQMNTGNCVHLFEDSVAVISHRRKAPLTEVEVDSLLFTTLLPQAPLVLINAEMEDAGILGRANCGCVFGETGFHRQIADVYSFGKLTAMGITLIGTDIITLLERDLPARFGGCPGDFQLVEREVHAQTEIILRISPRVGVSSAEVVKEYFLRELPNCNSGWVASRILRHTGSFRTVVGEPLPTLTGKILPLHVLGVSGRTGLPACQS